MKQVIKNKAKEHVVELSEIDSGSGKYYGFAIHKSSKGMIVNSGNGYFATYFHEMVYCHNNPLGGHQISLRSCVKRLLEGVNAKVFEFDSWEELFEWALGNKNC